MCAKQNSSDSNMVFIVKLHVAFKVFDMAQENKVIRNIEYKGWFETLLNILNIIT